MIVLVGYPGAGKSRFGTNFAEVVNIPLISLEKLETINAPQALPYMLSQLLKTKSNFIYDGDSHNDKLRNSLSKIAKQNGYETLFVWLQTEMATARARHGAKSSDKDFDSLISSFIPPTQKGDLIVISGKHAFSTQMRMVLGRLLDHKSNRPAPKPPARKINIRS